MKPIKFKGANKVYTKPKGWTDEECGPLYTLETHSGIVSSIWQPTEVERVQLAAGHAVVLSVHANGILPPMALGVSELTASQIIKESD